MVAGRALRVDNETPIPVDIHHTLTSYTSQNGQQTPIGMHHPMVPANSDAGMRLSHWIQGLQHGDHPYLQNYAVPGHLVHLNPGGCRMWSTVNDTTVNDLFSGHAAEYLEIAKDKAYDDFTRGRRDILAYHQYGLYKFYDTRRDSSEWCTQRRSFIERHNLPGVAFDAVERRSSGTLIIHEIKSLDNYTNCGRTLGSALRQLQQYNDRLRQRFPGSWPDNAALSIVLVARVDAGWNRDRIVSAVERRRVALVSAQVQVHVQHSPDADEFERIV